MVIMKIIKFFNSEKENKLQLLTNNSIIINDNINLVNLEISDIKNKNFCSYEKNEIFILIILILWKEI